MAKKHSLHLESGLRYDGAGLLFKMIIDLPEDRADDQGASLSIIAENLSSGAKVPFNNAASPPLADFMASYPRWMARFGIRATKGDDEITGTARASDSVEDLLKVSGLLGDMIDQKFSLHAESVLV